MSAHVPRRILIAPEIACYPLWADDNDREPLCPISPDSLPISQELIAAFDEWDQTWQDHYDDDMRPGPLDLETFDKAGRELWRRLQCELSSRATVDYFSYFTERTESVSPTGGGCFRPSGSE